MSVWLPVDQCVPSNHAYRNHDLRNLSHLFLIQRVRPRFLSWGVIGGTQWVGVSCLAKRLCEARHKTPSNRWLCSFGQRLTFPFPFVHHQPHDWKVEQLLTVETRTRLIQKLFHSVSREIECVFLSCIWGALDPGLTYSSQPRDLVSTPLVCKVRTQQAENFDEEVKSLVSAWCSFLSFSFSFLCKH